MMPNIVKGSDTSHLLRYLVGPGKRNEHTSPHLVAGDPVVMAWYGTSELSYEDASVIARSIDAPMAQLDQVRANAKLTWHCSLSLAPDEPALDDETWGLIASDFMAAMGWEADEGSPAARWVAVHHGVTVAGGDHIHIAASRVREDGTIVSTGADFARAQAAAGMIERKYGLTVLASRDLDRGSRGLKPGEVERAAREGYEEPVRETLARKVRACASAAQRDEAEFVRLLRREGLLVQPFYAKGSGNAEVDGYSVALRLTPEQEANGVQVKYIGGGKLGRDLTLPALRAGWGNDETITSPAAAQEWWAAKRHRRIVHPMLQQQRISQEHVTRARDEAAQLRAQLQSIPGTDIARWSAVTTRIAGLYATISTRSPNREDRDLYWDSARVLAEAGQTRAHARRRIPRSDPAAGLLDTAALVFMHRGRHDNTLMMTELMMQLSLLSRLVSHAQEAAEDRRHAARIRAVEERRLAHETPMLDHTAHGIDSATLQGIRAAQATMTAPPNTRTPSRSVTPDRQPPWRPPQVQPGRDDRGRGTTD